MGPVSDTFAPVIAWTRASTSARCADQSMSMGVTSAADITATSATAMMVRTLRTGKRFPLRLDKPQRERLGDHRGPKWRESMTETTNGRVGGGNAHRRARHRRYAPERDKSRRPPGHGPAFDSRK